MIRLLYFTPAIAILGGLLMIYMVYLKPVFIDNHGKTLSAAAAVDEMKKDLKKIKLQHDLLAVSMQDQKKNLSTENENAIKIYDKVSGDEFKDIELIKLKDSIVDFNQKAIALSGNQSAIIEFNDQLKEGIKALDQQVQELDLADLLRPKEEVSNRLNAIQIQVARLTELQRSIIEKSLEYNQKSKESISNLKEILKEQSINMASLNSDRTIELQEKIKETVDKENEMLAKFHEESVNLATIRKQNLEQMVDSKERVKDMLEDLRIKMDLAKDKMEDNKDRERDVKDQQIEAKERASEARQRMLDLKESLRDRGK